MISVHVVGPLQMQEVSDAGQQAAIEAIGKQFGHSRCHGVADASILLAVEVEAGERGLARCQSDVEALHAGRRLPPSQAHIGSSQARRW